MGVALISAPPRASARPLKRAALLLALSLGVAPLGIAASAQTPALAKGQAVSLADLYEQVGDAVVNISASQTVVDKTVTAPELPRGTPFDDLFDQYFKRNQQSAQNPDSGPPAPREHGASSLGSGFIIDSSGIVITNNHVIADANDITVILTDGEKLKAELVGKDDKVDVAVLRIKPDKPLKSVKFADSDKIRVGDPVMAVGNPFGLGGTVTAGIISARNRNIDSGPYDNYIQTDASINKGNSGGPLFDMNGDVIGIDTAILSPTGGSIGIGFATPANTVMPIIDELRQYGETRRGWLGVNIQNVDDSIAESLNLGSPRGALVASVDEHGPALPAGIKAGDVIVRFNGKDIKESRDLPGLVASTAVGQTVPVTIVRDGKEQDITVTLGRLEDEEKLAALETDKQNNPAAPTVVQKALGMSFSSLTADTRKQFSIKDDVKGVVVTTVDPDSPAAQKNIAAGDTIVEVNQESVNQPSDVLDKMKAAKDAGRKTALLLVANPQGEVRFVAVALE